MEKSFETTSTPNNGIERTPTTSSHDTPTEHASGMTWTVEEEKAATKKYAFLLVVPFLFELTNVFRVDFIVLPLLMAIYFTFQLDRANMLV